MKVGELLVREGLISAAQLDVALGLQRRFACRLGSVLVELGYVDSDVLARALSGQLRVPAALSRHVAAIDPKIIAIFTPRLAAEARAIPLGYTSTTPRRLLVALRDPTTTPIEELAFAAGVRIDVAVAPEIVIARCLEQYYGVKHGWSELRLAISAGGGDNLSDSWPPTASDVPEPAPRGASPKPTPSHPLLTLSLPPMPLALAAAPAPADPAPAGVISEPSLTLEPPPRPRWEPATAAALEEELEAARLELSHERSEEVVTLDDAVLISASSAEAPGHIAWGELFAAAPPIARTAPPGALEPVLDVAAAMAALEQAMTRDEVGDTLTMWLSSEYECGLVLIVKDGTALGWKGRAPDAEQELIESIAMPLGPPSMLAAAYEQRVVFCGPPPAEGAALQTRLWKLLRCTPPSEVLVAPIALGHRVVNLLYAHTRRGLPPSSADDAMRVASAASAAYARVIRKKK